MKYVNATNNVILAPCAGTLKAVAPGQEIELLVAQMPGLVAVKSVAQVKVKEKKHVAKKPVRRS